MPESTAERRNEQPQVRGCLITARIAYAAKTYGDEKRSIVLGRLGTSERKRLENVAADGDWFDYATYETVERALLELCGKGDDQFHVELGRASADYNLKRIQSIRTAGIDPEQLLQRLCKMPLFDNFGEGEFESLEVPDGRGAALTYDYPAEVTDLYVKGEVGFYARLMERLGGTNVSVTTTHLDDRGPNSIRYEIRWEHGSPHDEEGDGAITDDAFAPTPDQRRANDAHDPLGKMFREAVATSKPAAPEPAATKKKLDVKLPRFLRNAKLVGAAAVALLVLAGVEYAWFSGAFVPAHRGYLGGHMFTRTGDLDVVVALDNRTLLLEPGVMVSNVRVDAHVGTTVYTATYAALPATAFVHIELSQMVSPTGEHPPISEVPSKVVVEAFVDGRKAVGEFRP